MRIFSAVAGVVLGTVTLGVLASAHAQSRCDSLWVERNSYYKEGGYCFKTQRAIQRFGNAGCQYDNENEVPLSNFVRARINEIVREERALGCRD